MRIRICPTCKKFFFPSEKEAKQIYCSNECAWKAQRKALICVGCGKEFWRPDANKNKQRYCSDECKIETKKQHIAAAETRRQEEMIIKEKQRHKVCRYCGKEFIASTSIQVYCSKDCRDEFHRKKARQRTAEAFNPGAFICRECGSSFIPEHNEGGYRTVFCSQICADKHDARRKHASEGHKRYKREYLKRREKLMRKNYVEDVSYDELYRRDQGICQICGLPVIADKHLDINWSGCIDHIIPIASGGKHAMGNCQLAHRICNCIKGTEEEVRIDWEEKAINSNYWNKLLHGYKQMMG